ncbi:hypothetical protein [Shewanella psychrotolerans]|uniref:hypothetical protein n=1 Tax=Shewanella psychrotolerans TaxID=2864206 RepID=UPI001C65E758|nr:hypothetical protein [Shewanella psychrotolerans]QYK00278.1 hypothetical protein K0I62_12765 [Shewanella psychrotolerans]
MKKVFNASILAAAVALSFGANAADVAISQTLDITNEASAAKVAGTAFNADITFYNREELSAGDKVTLSFPFGTTLPLVADITVDTGAGVGTFESPVLVAEDTVKKIGPKIELVVATGSPVLNNSKTVVQLAGAAPAYLPTAGQLVYSAEDGFSGDAKDTTGQNSVALTTSTDQEVASVSAVFDGYVNRLNRDTYVTTKGNLVAEVTSTRPTATVKATVATETLVLTAKKDLADLTKASLYSCDDNSAVSFSATGVASCASGNLETVDVAAAAFACSDAAAVPACSDTVVFDTSGLTYAAVTGGDQAKFSIYLTPTASKDIPLTTYTVDRVVTYTAAPTNLEYKYVNGADFGMFKLDASVVNVPYLPVGLGLTPNVEIANAGNTDAAIQLEGFDQNGVAYGPVALTKVAKKGAVTKVSEADIQAAFGLATDGSTAGKKKLSVTFVLDADAEDITLAPYYRQGESRVNVMSDQYKK